MNMLISVLLERTVINRETFLLPPLLIGSRALSLFRSIYDLKPHLSSRGEKRVSIKDEKNRSIFCETISTSVEYGGNCKNSLQPNGIIFHMILLVSTSEFPVFRLCLFKKPDTCACTIETVAIWVRMTLSAK